MLRNAVLWIALVVAIILTAFDIAHFVRLERTERGVVGLTPLFWIVHEVERERCVFIQEAGALIFARIRAGIAGFKDGEFLEAHALDAKMARRSRRK